jgi:predicted transcriptional regulator
LKARRSKVSIIIDVLSYLSEEGGEAPATRIAQATGLAYDRLVRLLEELNEKGIVVVEAGERARRVKLTRKGFLVLQKLRNLRDLLEDLGIEV